MRRQIMSVMFAVVLLLSPILPTSILAQKLVPGAALVSVPSGSGSTFATKQALIPEQIAGDTVEPGSVPFPALQSDLDLASSTAVLLSELAATGEYDELYEWMHPDAQAIVPKAVVAGWYREVFGWYPEMILVRAPVWTSVEDVQLVEWRWGVTDTVYPEAAAVSLRQGFADGFESDGTIWLVRNQDGWRWFFGRDRDFVDRQIARFGGAVHAAADGSTEFLITDLGIGSNGSEAFSINEAGDVLGYWPAYVRPERGWSLDDLHQVLWTQGTLIDLTARGIGWPFTFDEHGDVVGPSELGDGQWLVYEADSGLVEPFALPSPPVVAPPPGFAGGTVEATNA